MKVRDTVDPDRPGNRLGGGFVVAARDAVQHPRQQQVVHRALPMQRLIRPQRHLAPRDMANPGHVNRHALARQADRPGVAAMGVFPLLKSLLPVVVAFLLPTTDTLDHRRVGNGTHRHGLFQEPMEELPAMA